ncbi:MAG: NAD-dependent epimerase/dehydratase family protein [Bacillota bacterium]|nr:NAD-dependent epimerase/dehydratase family protein [Bacillota bacterium]
MILVTGAAGHVGNVLARRLSEKGEKLRLLLSPTSNEKALSGIDGEIIRMNTLERQKVREAVRGCRLVYHCAGVIDIAGTNSKRMKDSNVLGTKSVVDACLQEGVERLVYVSTIHVLEEAPRGSATTEVLCKDDREVVGLYGKTKLEATNYVLDAVKKGLNAVITYPTGIIGPYDFKGSELGTQIRRYARKNHLQLYLNGGYDFVDVRDVADGLILACEKGKTGQGYILSGQKLTLKEILDTVEQCTGFKNPKFCVPVWLAYFGGCFTPVFSLITGRKAVFTIYSIKTVRSNSQISCRKAREELGYSPRPVTESIRDALVWSGHVQK